MKLNYKKQKLVESLGFNVNFKTTYGDKPQNVKITPSQFKRLMESYLIYEEKMHKEEEDMDLAEFANSFSNDTEEMLDEMNFGDGDLEDLEPYFEYQDDFDTENFNNSEDLDEGGMGYDNYMRDKYDGRDSEVIGVYSDIDNQRYGGKRMPGEGFYSDGNGFISEIKNMSKAQKDFILRETKKELNKRSRR